MLLIHIPQSYVTERDYICSVILYEQLGIDYVIKITDRRDICIEMNDSSGKLILPDILFGMQQEDWLKKKSLPSQPLKTLDVSRLELDAYITDNSLPIIYGKDPIRAEDFEVSDCCIRLPLDIFGSCFFMLTRYEEFVTPTRDLYDRFPATASLAYQEGFLQRPVVNEYIEVLWACFKYLWPNFERKQRHFKVYLSHDADLPYMHAFAGIPRLFRSCAADILKRRSPKALVKRIKDWSRVKSGKLEADPYNTFGILMDLSEQIGVKSSFYFIADNKTTMDGDYDIRDEIMCRLLKNIHDRGHEIGLHPSFTTYTNEEQTRKEFNRLKDVCSSLGIMQDSWGARQHYLRWSTSVTPQILSNAGLDYDTSLGYADMVGFRAGICCEYHMYDLVGRSKLELVERPLIIMEGTVTDMQYMGLGRGDNAKSKVYELIDQCKRHNGDFTLLWHNSRFYETDDIKMYDEILNYLSLLL